MFETLQMAPPDAILGLTEAFKSDPNPQKINLSVGVYKDASGATPILKVVREAEKRLLAQEDSKSYLGMDGLPEYGKYVRELLFGTDHPIVTEGRAVTAQTPGGTGALRVAGDFLKSVIGCDRIWCSDPTWANHPGVFQAAGLQVDKYRYVNDEGIGLDFEGMLSALSNIPAGDAICLHACCQNPTGIDPTPQQWAEIGSLLRERNILPLIDFAYQGFAMGIEEDAAGLRALLEFTPDALICSSFSKNFGLYAERVGALTLVGSTTDAIKAALSHLKLCIRTNYSNPPKHGGAIVATVLGDAQLRSQWADEVTAMRERVSGMRQLFVDTLKAEGVDRDFSFITQQNGMFSMSQLTPEQVDRLRDEYSIYIVRSGRVNVAGMTADNMGQLCKAIASVL